MSPGPIFFILTQYLEIDWLHRPTFDVGRIGQNSMELIGGIAGPRAPSLVERHDRAQATQEPQSAASARGLRQIGRASCGERVCTYVLIWGVAGSCKTKNTI